MEIRRVALIVVLSLLAAPAHADRHFADLMVGGFKAKGSDFDGKQYSGSWPIDPCVDLSLVVSFGRYNGKEGKEGDDENADHALTTYIVGLRWTHHWKILGHETLPFGQLLVGGVGNQRKPTAGPPGTRETTTHTLYVAGIGIQPAIFRQKLRLRFQADLFYRTKRHLGPFEPGGAGYAGSIGLMYQFHVPLKCKKACSPLPCPASPKQGDGDHAARLVPADRHGPLELGERVDRGAASSLP